MKIVKYIMFFILMTTIGMLFDRYKKKFLPDEELDKYNLVRKFLLNESESNNGKPLLWIHSDYEVNARNWESFYSRNSKQGNQPYIDLCVESVIKHCGQSFNICLINDDTFSKLLPKWSIKINGLSNPIKKHVRTLALCKLLHIYGGMCIPNSLIVMKDLKSLYDEKIKENCMFVAELLNRNSSSVYTQFFPSHKIMGCKPKCNEMDIIISELEISISNDNTDEKEFNGLLDRQLYSLVNKNQISLICGKAFGCKDKEENKVLVDDLLIEQEIKYCLCSLYGIYLPKNEILARTKFNWFVRLSHKQVLESNTQAAKYLLISLGK